MPEYPSANPGQFIQGAPVLHVPDVEAAARYYIEVLGFTRDFGDQEYAVVWRDNSAIHFVRSDSNPTGVHLFQWVRDVDACYRELVSRGARVTVEPGNRVYGVRDFAICDSNGVSVIFGQDIEAEPPAPGDARKDARR